MTHDVIVVGAGPAGSTAAAFLAKAGVKTLLLDRASFPRPKTCGDAIPIAAYEIFDEMGIQTIYEANYYRIKRVIHRNMAETESIFELTNSDFSHSEAFVAPRYDFDHLLFQHAIACGAEFQQVQVQAPLFENGQLVGVSGKSGDNSICYYGKVVIVADGASSVIARALNPKHRGDKHTAVAIRAYVETNCELEPAIEIDFMEETLPGYAWFFPTAKHRANIGMGIRADFYKKQDFSLDEIVDIYRRKSYIFKRIGNNPLEDLKSWQIPLFSFDTQRVFDGAILVGDAGQFVNQITGDGIYEALFTGRAAAKTVLQAIASDNYSQAALASFDDLWREKLGKRFKEAEVLNNLASLAPNIISRAIFHTATPSQ
jgi:geranylgeranyl reductase family protein